VLDDSHDDIDRFLHAVRLHPDARPPAAPTESGGGPAKSEPERITLLGCALAMLCFAFAFFIVAAGLAVLLGTMQR